MRNRLKIREKDGRMNIATNKQPNEAAVVSPTLSTEDTVTTEPIVGETMAVVVSKLSNLRERYFEELKMAREKVKKNFLK